METQNGEIENLAELLAIPIHCLGSESLKALSSGLELQQVIPGRNKYSRDWRVLAQLVLPHETVQRLLESQDPVRETLNLWPEEATVGQLVSALEGVERFDVVEDSMESILIDCRDYIRRRDEWQQEPSKIHLTMFHAFVIHVEKNGGFVRDLARRAAEAGLSLFIPERDFPAAQSSYMLSLFEIMQRRCSKVIVVVSAAFAQSQDARSLLENAERIHAQQARKLIPIILEDCPHVGFMISTVSKIRFDICDDPWDWAWPRLVGALLATEETSSV